MRKFKCKQCGQEFIDYRSSERKYCSRDCYAAALSEKCKGKGVAGDDHYIRPSKKKIKKICINCGREFEIWNYRKDTAKYCSKKCKVEDGNEVVKCKFCGEDFMACSSSNRVFCSRECYLLFQL